MNNCMAYIRCATNHFMQTRIGYNGWVVSSAAMVEGGLRQSVRNTSAKKRYRKYPYRGSRPERKRTTRTPTHAEIGRDGTERGEVGGTHVIHSRSRVAIDPRIPTIPGRSTSGFD